jgi:formamidopyrimidine-DNA glycosylase
MENEESEQIHGKEDSSCKGAGPTFLVYGNHQRTVFWMQVCQDR